MSFVLSDRVTQLRITDAPVLATLTTVAALCGLTLLLPEPTASEVLLAFIAVELTIALVLSAARGR